MILQSAFDLARQEGMASLSARRISKKLNCSTQPIYSCFKTMKELEIAVIDKAKEFVIKTYLSRKDLLEDHFLNMGLGYIKLAKTDPHLFDLLYLSGPSKSTDENDFFPIKQTILIETMKRDERLKALDNDVLSTILNHMRIYTHGLAMLARSDFNMTDATIFNLLHEMGNTLILSKLREQGIQFDETHCH